MTSPQHIAETATADLPAELHLTAAEAGSWLDVPGHVMTPDLARLTGFAPDYVWATWLADVLREAGVNVIEYPGWETRGRPRSVGPFDPLGVIWHHDASAPGPSPAMARFIAQEGRPAEGIPAPLAQLWVCMGCNGAHKLGTWHVLAAGRANHAGLGGGWGRFAADQGNTQAIGVETDNTTGEPTPRAMLAALVDGTAAILDHLGARAGDSLCGHKEYAAGRKTDPDDIDMDAARTMVALAKHGATTPPPTGGGALVPFPGVKHFTLGHECVHGYVGQLGTWLCQLGEQDNALQLAGRTFTERHRRAVAHFQRSEPSLATDPDGVPGPLTWRLLQSRVRHHGR